MIGSVEGIGMRPHLQDGGVHVERDKFVEYGDCLAFLFGFAQAFFGWPIDVVNRGDPGRAELTVEFRRLILGVNSRNRRDAQKDCKVAAIHERA